MPAPARRARPGRQQPPPCDSACDARPVRRGEAHHRRRSAPCERARLTGDLAGGESLAREAVALAAEVATLNLHGDALSGLGRVLELAGKPEEAAASFAEAAELYVRKGNLVMLERTRERLQALRAPAS